MFDLNTLRKECELRNIPIISTQTQDLLISYLYKHKPKVCLEIGSAEGYSTICIGSIIQARGGTILSFEIAYPSYLQGLRNIKESGLDNILLYPFDVNQIDLKKLIHKEIDFAFVDGQKSQYKSYLTKIENMISQNGYIVLDDVIKYYNKLEPLYRYLEKKQIFYKQIETEPGDGVIVIEKISI